MGGSSGREDFINASLCLASVFRRKNNAVSEQASRNHNLCIRTNTLRCSGILISERAGQRELVGSAGFEQLDQYPFGRAED